MKQHADGYKISDGAWKEMKDRIELFFEIHMQDICDIAKSKGRRTVFEEDVIQYFGYVGSDELRGEEE